MHTNNNNQALLVIDNYLKQIEESVLSSEIVDPTKWLERAMKINAVMNSLIDRISELETIVANKRHELVVHNDEKGDKMTSAKAKIICEAMPEYQESQRLTNKKKQAEEFIRLCKKRAMMDADLYKIQ